MKQLLLGAGLAVLLIAGAVGVLRWNYARGVRQRAAERLPELRREAFDAVPICDDREGVRTQIAQGTSKFEVYLHMDRRAIGETLRRVVDPVIGARESACAHAQTMLELFIEKSPTLDAFAMPRLVHVHAMLAYLAEREAELQATLAAFDAGASDDELRRHISRLRR